MRRKVNGAVPTEPGAVVQDGAAVVEPKRRRQVAKGGFAVYRVVELTDEKTTMGVEKFGKAKQAMVVAETPEGTKARGLADTTEAMDWIRQHATIFNGEKLLIVQEKREVTPKVERIERIIIE
jgi:hypothetical protein